MILPPTSWDVRLHGLRKGHLKIWIQIHSNSNLPWKKKRVFFSVFFSWRKAGKQPKKKQKKHLWESRTKRFQRCKFPCRGTLKAWVTNRDNWQGQLPGSVGSVLNHWRQPRHLDEVSLGHGRADTSTFKSVQLVPAHVDNMFLDIKCFDHRNAVFKKKKASKKSQRFWWCATPTNWNLHHLGPKKGSWLKLAKPTWTTRSCTCCWSTLLSLSNHNKKFEWFDPHGVAVSQRNNHGLVWLHWMKCYAVFSWFAILIKHISNIDITYINQYMKIALVIIYVLIIYECFTITKSSLIPQHGLASNQQSLHLLPLQRYRPGPRRMEVIDVVLVHQMPALAIWRSASIT